MPTPKRPPAPSPHLPEEASPDSDRPTVPPSFDLDEFARDSEVRLRSVQPATGETTTDEARRLLEQGEPEMALFLLARLLQLAPMNADASALSQKCSVALEQQCWSVIGPHSTILVVAVSPGELKGFALDNVSGFLLALIDGRTNVETLLDLCGLPRLTALRHLRDLVTRGIVQIRARGT